MDSDFPPNSFSFLFSFHLIYYKESNPVLLFSKWDPDRNLQKVFRGNGGGGPKRSHKTQLDETYLDEIQGGGERPKFSYHVLKTLL